MKKSENIPLNHINLECLIGNAHHLNEAAIYVYKKKKNKNIKIATNMDSSY